MKKTYVYTIHLPDGTAIVTPPYSDLIKLRKGTMALLTSLDMDPDTKAILKARASDAIAELKESNKEFIRAIKEADKAKAAASQPLKEPGKKLGSSYAYVKAWREANPDKFAASKANQKLRAAGMLPPADVIKAEKKRKKQLNQLAQLKHDMHKLYGTGSDEFTRLNKRKKALEAELGLK